MTCLATHTLLLLQFWERCYAWQTKYDGIVADASYSSAAYWSDTRSSFFWCKIQAELTLIAGLSTLSLGHQKSYRSFAKKANSSIMSSRHQVHTVSHTHTSHKTAPAAAMCLAVDTTVATPASGAHSAQSSHNKVHASPPWQLWVQCHLNINSSRLLYRNFSMKACPGIISFYPSIMSSRHQEQMIEAY